MNNVIKRTITREIAIKRSPRVMQLEGMFDVEQADIERRTWDLDIQIPDEWNVGVIVGGSGEGKSTLAFELFGDLLVESWPWKPDEAIVDGFPDLPIKEITGLLSSVGFSSPPSWRKPYPVLSTGEKFRVDLARTIAERGEKTSVFDEFTSVVDRQVAQIGSAAISRTVKRRGGKFVAVTCHHDVLDWLEPDWVIDVRPGAKIKVQLNSQGDARRWVRPKVDLKVVRCERETWDRFKANHYLSGDLHRSAQCFAGLISGDHGNDRLAAFVAVLPYPNKDRSGWREHRLVTLPDFQGIGIGHAMSAAVASMYVAKGEPYFSASSHPSVIGHRTRSPNWKLIRAGIHMGGNKGLKALDGGEHKSSSGRYTASFEFVGAADVAGAKKFGILK